MTDNDKLMETTVKKRGKRKLTLEERRAINAAKPIRNKSMAAFAAHQGEFWVRDPMLLL